ncbi:MAG: hypothetical protein JW839_12020 [Candidatus Lokiarchaeota archaeon]|nr:hypothetical protein [Candidatus Lokiarchaeota archaeon]
MLSCASFVFFHVVPPFSDGVAILRARIAEGKNLTIFCDGEQSRDFTCGNDVVRAKMLTGTLAMGAGKVMAITSGKPITMNELTGIVFEVCKQEKPR